MAAAKTGAENLGKKLGFLIMFLVFTTVLYFLLFFLNKLPENWTYLHVMLMTIFIILIGTLLKFLLK